MIISHEFKYIFIEIPLTASWAIARELCDFYGGEPILHKHAAYIEFEHSASEKEKGYFKFATVRNPLDQAVSRYFKMKTNHKEAFTDPEILAAGKVAHSDLVKFRYIQENDADFAAYFKRYQRLPVDDMIDLSADHLDFVIRYENLQEDFAHVLSVLNIKQIQPIPVRNKTGSRRKEWQDYYEPSMYKPAVHSFGPLMQQWGYRFPADWGNINFRRRDDWLFRILKVGRRTYLTQIRYSDNFASKLARKMRAMLSR